MRWTERRVSVFCGLLADMLQSGLPLRQALILLRDRLPFGKQQLGGLITGISDGKPLSVCLKETEFPLFLVSLIGVAEEMGQYELALKQGEWWYTKTAAWRSMILQSLLYPLLILLMALAAFGLLVFYVIPRFALLYRSLGMDLPVLTEWLFHLSYRLVKMAVWVAGIFLGLVVIFAALAFSSKTKLAFGYWQLRLPVYNRWLRLRYTHFLFYQWGMLLKSGSPIIAALTSVEQVSPWVVLDDTIQKLRRTIERGYPLVDALEQVPFIPKQTLAAIAVAERTGILGERMLTVGEQSERQLEQYINRLTRWFEPLLLLVVGGLVGLIMILIFMPMLNFIQSM